MCCSASPFDPPESKRINVLPRPIGVQSARLPTYGMGVSRLSCVFCTMASRTDLRRAAQLQPALYRRYVDPERRIGHILSPSGVPL